MNSTPHLSKGHQCFPVGNGNLNLTRDIFFQTGPASSYPENKIWSDNFWGLPKAEAVQALVLLRRTGIRIMIEEEGDGPGLVDLVTDLPADMEQQVSTQVLAVRQLRIVFAVQTRP